MRKSKSATMAVACQRLSLGLKLSLTALAATGLVVTATASSAEEPGSTYTLDIPAQKLNDALQALALASQHKLLYSSKLIDGKVSPAIKGTFTAEDAVKKLLYGTGLDYQVTTDGLVVIRAPDDHAVYSSSQAAGPGVMRNPSPSLSPSNGESEGGGRVRMVQSDVSTSSSLSKSNGEGLEARATIDEIIVTAQKRSERLQDVPIPVTVLNAASLTDNNQTKIQDYYMQVPGLSYAPAAFGTSLLSIRGITTGGDLATSTVGVVIDDVPFGGTGVTIIPDFDPGDLARLEVLRGPQGTLYGASSMGGLLKFVTVDPSTDRISGRLEAGTNSIRNGSKLGYNVRGSVNVPLSSTLAIRVSAYHRVDPGYIDNPILSIRGANEDRADGGHLSALWRLADSFSLKLSALYQDLKADSTNDFTTIDYITGQPLKGLQQGYIRGGAINETKAQAYSATLTTKVGNIDLTAISGYNINHNFNTYDVTAALGSFTEQQFGPGVTGTPATVDSTTRKITQEVRLSAPIGEKAEILLGGFYTQERRWYAEYIYGARPYTGAYVGCWICAGPSSGADADPIKYAEYAAFTDLTYHFTDKFVVQLGGRYSKINASTPSSYTYGPFGPTFAGTPDPSFNSPAKSSSSPITYLLSPQFKLSSDLMIYARLASGYRPGGSNGSPPPAGAPAEFKPDKTNNYEIGVKGDFYDHRLSAEASVYYIDWKAIQIGLVNPVTGGSYTGNAGAAKSQGIEISMESRPAAGLRLAAWASLGTAELTKPFPPGAVLAGTYGAAGDTLPNNAHFSGNISADQELPITGTIVGYGGATLGYAGARKDVFTACSAFLSPGVCVAPPARQELGAYSKIDLRAGIRNESWNANLYVNNIANRRGLISGGLGNFIPYNFYFIQPRTIGLNISHAF